MDAGNSKQTELLLNGPPLILLPFRNQFSSNLRREMPRRVGYSWLLESTS